MQKNSQPLGTTLHLQSQFKHLCRTRRSSLCFLEPLAYSSSEVHEQTEGPGLDAEGVLELFKQRTAQKWRAAPWCCWLCQLSHRERWNSCTNLQGCAPRWRETLYPNPPMLLSQKSGENKTPAVQMEILKVTNSTSPVHPHCTAGHSPKHCTPSRWAKKWGFPYLTEEQPPGRRWLSQGYTAAGRGLAVSGNGNN